MEKQGSNEENSPMKLKRRSDMKISFDDYQEADANSPGILETDEGIEGSASVAGRVTPYYFSAKFNPKRNNMASEDLPVSGFNPNDLTSPRFTSFSVPEKAVQKQSKDLRQSVLRRNLTHKTVIVESTNSLPNGFNRDLPRGAVSANPFGKVVKMKNTKKDFSMSQGKMKMKARTFKKALEKSNVVLPPLIAPSPVAKPVLRKTGSNKDLIVRDTHSSKDIEGSQFFCSYLMQQPIEGILEIDIADSGCGISQDEKEKLFKPFSQANKAVHSKYGGTGLGLWLSSKLVNAMKGTITCESKVNEGTVFKVRIPTKCLSGKQALPVINTTIIGNRLLISIFKEYSKALLLFAAYRHPRRFRNIYLPLDAR